MKAFIKNYRQSPRKVRLVADVIRGKEVGYVLTMLNFLQKRTAAPMKKLLESAVANAKHAGVKNVETLIVKKVNVDEGLVFKRLEYRARGSANLLKKRTSHISIVLGEKESADKLTNSTSQKVAITKSTV